MKRKEERKVDGEQIKRKRSEIKELTRGAGRKEDTRWSGGRGAEISQTSSLEEPNKEDSSIFSFLVLCSTPKKILKVPLVPSHVLPAICRLLFRAFSDAAPISTRL